MTSSIKSRLLSSLVGALTLAGLVSIVATYFSTRIEFSELFDAQLKHTALSLVEHHTLIAQTAVIGQSPQQQFLIQIYDSAHNQLYLSQAKSEEMLPLAESEGFSEVTTQSGAKWRQYAISSGTLIIQVAQPLSVRNALAMSSSLRILQPILAVLIFLALATWFVIVNSLKSLDKIARAVSLRSPSSLQPLPCDNLPQELTVLVRALNDLLKRLSESLTAQQRFASDAAHELRTPLAAIKLQSQLLSRAKTEEDKAKYAERLQQGIARATQLVQQLLTLARLDPDAHDKPLEEVNVASLAGNVIEDLDALAEFKGISLSAKAQSVLVLGMPDALRQMMANLTDNALRYTQEGGRIELSVEKTPTGAKICVTDDGPGIAPAERERVFERFYRALGTKVSGTGLGLAIVSRIIQIHQGKIAIEDGFAHTEDSGCGARFVIEIPFDPKKSP